MARCKKNAQKEHEFIVKAHKIDEKSTNIEMRLMQDNSNWRQEKSAYLKSLGKTLIKGENENRDVNGQLLELRIYESFGESAPQFLLQISIVIETGKGPLIIQ